MISRLVSIAPMMGWTDRHARYFLRLITKHSLLYTEMVNTGALLHNTQKVGSQKRLLAFHEAEHPVAIQLGGSDPQALAQCASMAEDAGFDEVNLNVGCPSDRVKSGNFGACLMATPDLVADCVSAMKAKVSVPVTVKCRIGIDDMEGYQSLEHFIEVVTEGGCDTFIVHARKAWLKGLSPKQNREIPPLKYDYVYRLKSEKPGLSISINGGIKTIESVQQQLEHVDGVMIGREAYYNPYILASVDRDVYHDTDAALKTREEVVYQMCDYIDDEITKGVDLHSITRHILGLYHGCRGARAWRRHLSEKA
ncbi:MAG: tRNA dihydrouridine(20/20a) synthase DusA, partial [Gammaproteobacteria bacterium]|nr:tRNA dihydrouridine(20/20a) synthase DusA [Gammaproteobacteria bacterium]